ncbi:MAG: hypothetical protein AABX00_03380 [Nanoarchaeota archaeon]
MKAVTQEHPMGCAVACTASLIGKNYMSTLILFSHPEYASTRGYYCKEICDALNKANLNYIWKRVTASTMPFLQRNGIIVFVKKSSKYPAGHFLLKTKKGWMNSWINYPSIKPAKAGFQRSLPGNAQWVIFPLDS